MGLRFALLGAALALALAPLGAQAQGSYRCVGKDGKKYYGTTIPPQCVGQAVEQLSPSGTVVKRFEPQASAADLAKKEAEEAEQKKRAAIAKEQGRRDQALLATYGSEKDIEQMRGRALAENQRVIEEARGKIAELKKRSATSRPGALDAEIQTQENLIQAKNKDVAAINAKYDDDRRRYLELTRK
jgi:hypothetical protein